MKATKKSILDPFSTRSRIFSRSCGRMASIEISDEKHLVITRQLLLKADRPPTSTNRIDPLKIYLYVRTTRQHSTQESLFNTWASLEVQDSQSAINHINKNDTVLFVRTTSPILSRSLVPTFVHLMSLPSSRSERILLWYFPPA